MKHVGKGGEKGESERGKIGERWEGRGGIDWIETDVDGRGFYRDDGAGDSVVIDRSLMD